MSLASPANRAVVHGCVSTTLLTLTAAAQQFAEHRISAFPTATPPTIVAVADVDGDGFPDLLAHDGAGVRLWRNQRDRSFAGGPVSPLTPGPSMPATFGDYDGDGDLDAFVSGGAYQNLGNNKFVVDATHAVTVAWMPQQSGLFDYDGDGDVDLLINVMGGLQLFANDGSGTWTNVTSITLAGLDRSSTVFVTPDIDGDGDLDVVKVNGGFVAPAVHVWRNDGSGSFAQEVLTPPPVAAMAAFMTVVVGDFDGDGLADVLLGRSNGTADMVLFRATGTGWLVTSVAAPQAVAAPLMGAAGDWDQDGSDDLICPSGVLRWNGSQFVHTPFPLPLGGLRVWAVDLDSDLRIDAIGERGLMFNTWTGPVPSEQSAVIGDGAMGYVNDVRRRAHGGTPVVEVLGTNYSSVAFAHNRPDPNAPEHRGMRSVRLLSGGVCRDAAIIDPPAPGMSTLIAVAESGTTALKLYEVQGDAALPFATLPISGTPWRVEAADLDGVPGDEIVVGALNFDGPQIFRRQGSTFLDVTPTLPQASGTGGAFEELRLADFDGDGDLDILHELRVIVNDAGTWSPGPSFAASVPSYALALVPIDFDDDGDDDLYIPVSNELGRLLESTPTGFVDVSATRLTGSLLASSTPATDRLAADLDGDGDLDLLMPSYTGSHILRNDGGTFVAIASVPIRGAPIDCNFDGCFDLFVGSRLLVNQHTELWARNAPYLGRPWLLEFDSWRTGSPVIATWLLAAMAEQHTSVPGLGELFLAGPLVTVATLLPVDGHASHSLTWPVTPALAGQFVVLQPLALDGQGLRLGNALRARLH